MSKRDLILQTTLELITELGFHATPMSLIIKKSDVASGTIYHYFKSKENEGTWFMIRLPLASEFVVVY